MSMTVKQNGDSGDNFFAHACIYFFLSQLGSKVVIVIITSILFFRLVYLLLLLFLPLRW